MRQPDAEGRGMLYAPGLVMSLVPLAAIIIFALFGLGAAGNWPKLFRVAAAALSYGMVLLWLSRGSDSLRFGAFLAAGATAGAVSGLARPAASTGLVLASVAGAALLLAPLHWGALRTRSRLLRSRPAPSSLRSSARPDTGN